MDRTLEGISIGDSNLFRSSTSRCYLFGLAAFAKVPIRLVPSLLHPWEVPGQIARSCMVDDTYLRSMAVSSEERALFSDERGRFEAQVFGEIQNWMSRWIESRVIEVKEPQNAKDLAVLRGTLRPYCHPNYEGEIEPRDLQIVAECVAVGAEYIATHNFISIDHGDLNSWARHSKGLNRNIIGNVSDLSALILNDVQNELIIIGAMASSGEPRSFIEETQSIDRFIINLFRSNYNRLAKEVQAIWENMKSEEVMLFLNQSRELSNTPTFVQAKSMNDELVEISNQARLEWRAVLNKLGFLD